VNRFSWTFGPQGNYVKRKTGTVTKIPKYKNLYLGILVTVPVLSSKILGSDAALFPYTVAEERRIMSINPARVVLVAIFFWSVASADRSAAAQARPAGTPCDRACLREMIDQYLGALAAHDPARAPLAPNVRFAQDNQPLRVGEALWMTASGLGKYRHYFIDPQRGDAGLIGVIYENGTGAILLLHLKVENRQITEAEQWVAHDPAGAATYEKRGAPEALWSEPIPPDRRQSREALQATAYMYFQALEKNDGKGIYPFTDDCERSEDGVQTSNREKPMSYGHSDTSVSDFTLMGCKAQFSLGLFGFTTGARDRHYLVVDPEYGSVLGCAFLEFDGSQPDFIPLTDGRKWPVAPYFWTSRTNQLHEGFRIENGGIRRVEMTMYEIPFATRSAFAPPDPAPEVKTVPGAGKSADACDQKCLRALVDQVFETMISHCSCCGPLAKNVRYTENGQVVRPGEGLWRTLSTRGDYRVYLADPATGQAGYYGDINEKGLLGMLALRLKVEARRITEIEAIVVREQLRPGSRKAQAGLAEDTAGIMTPRMLDELQPKGFVRADPILQQIVPRTGRVPRAQLVSITERYFDAFAQAKGAMAPLDERCVRRENGIPATGNPDGPVVDPAQPAFRLFGQGCAQELDTGFFSSFMRLRDRYRMVVDEEQGLVLHLGLFDAAGNVKSVAVPGAGKVALPPDYLRPVTYIAPQLFKIINGRIRLIEGLAWPVPYGMKSGWERGVGDALRP